MSAPSPAPGDDRPREGYYPDPSIPGYVRYWNGSAWVPGTSRPAPSGGELLTPPPAVAQPPRQPPHTPAAADGGQPGGVRGPVPGSVPGALPDAVEETGPHFFDEDPEPGAPYGGGPRPASAWGADRAHQSGFGSDQDRRVSWGAPPADPRVPAHAPPAQPDGTFVSGRPVPGDGTAAATASPGAPGDGAGGPGVTGSGGSAPTGVDGGPRFAGGSAATGPASAPSPAGRAAAPTTAVHGQAGLQGEAAGAAADEGTMTFRATPAVPAGPGFGAGKAAAERAASAQAAPASADPGAAPSPRQPAAGVPAQSAAAQRQQAAGAPVTAGAGGGQPSWAQQVHRLAGGAGDEQPVAPWKPPVDDPFQAAARRQAAARPAGLGRRLAARLIDTVVVAGVTAVAAVPLGAQALDHIQGKIDAAKQSGETVTVWLLDGTTSLGLGVVVAVLLLTGVLYEALPTARWGRTLGKRVLGLEVRDIEAHEPPGFGAALRRWLVYSIPGLLCFGVIGVLWCVFDRPWRQCWHDKAARTFVAG